MQWHYALFYYGAIVLKNKEINRHSRHYKKQSEFKGSFRSFRTKVVKFLLAQSQNRASHKQTQRLLRTALQKEKTPYSTQKVLDSLLKDKLIKKSLTHYYL